MKMYHTKLRIIVPVAVDAESGEEAQRIIDGVIDNVTFAGIVEGEFYCPDDVLFGMPERLERDDITSEE